MSAVQKKELQEITSREYQYGFVTDIETDVAPRGLNEDVIRLISSKKNEPEWLLAWRLKAYRHWLTMKEPNWQNAHYGPIDYQDIIYYAAIKPGLVAVWCRSFDSVMCSKGDELWAQSGRMNFARMRYGLR